MTCRWTLLLLCLVPAACFDPTAVASDGSSGTGDGPDPQTTTGVDVTSDDPSATSNVSATGMTSPTTDATTSPMTTDATDSSGEPSEPEIDVSIDGTPVGTMETFAIAATTDVGMPGSTVTVTVDNVGTADLTLGGVVAEGADAGEFNMNAATLPGTLAPGESGNFTVQFAPSTGGLKTLRLSIDNDDADESPYEFDLTGHTTPNRWRQIMTVGPPARFNAAMAPLPDGRFVLFGGRNPMGNTIGDTWIFDSTTDTWTNAVPAMSPPARFSHEMAHVDGEVVVLYGGTPGQGMLGFADTWTYDAGTNQWTPVMTPGPGPRFQHMMTSIGSSQVLLNGGRSGMFSGMESPQTWRFDGGTNTWVNTNATGAPAGRSAAAFAWDRADSVVMYGGFVNVANQTETWVYSLATNAWSNAVPPTNPGARAVMEGVLLDDGRIYTFGGKVGNCCIAPSQGTSAYNPVSNTWTNAMPPSQPPARFNYTLESAPGRNKAILFGGALQNVGIDTAQNDTWEYVGPVP